MRLRSRSARTFVGTLAALGLTALAVVGFTGTAGATGAPAAVTCANVKGPAVHTVDSSIVNRPDSGKVGNWALDKFKRHADIYVLPDAPTAAKVEVSSHTYLVCGVDSGTFVTMNGKSPGHALPMINGMKGSFSGAWSAKVKAPAEGFFVGGSDANTLSTSQWIDHLWSEGDSLAAPFTDWRWTYALCEVDKRHLGDVKWINANGGNFGDIRTDKWCAKPSPSPSASPSGSVKPTTPVAVTPTSGAPSLPVTGPNAVIYGGGAAALLALGVTLFVVARRRRVRFEA
jgi:hypothetical protein